MTDKEQAIKYVEELIKEVKKRANAGSWWNDNSVYELVNKYNKALALLKEKHHCDKNCEKKGEMRCQDLRNGQKKKLNLNKNLILQDSLFCFTHNNARKEGWKAALQWYKNAADECEKDCSTNEDYKTLYFHLKQVLENELKE